MKHYQWNAAYKIKRNLKYLMFIENESINIKYIFVTVAEKR